MSLPVFIKAAANTPTLCWSAQTVMRAGSVTKIIECEKTILSGQSGFISISYMESLLMCGFIFIN